MIKATAKQIAEVTDLINNCRSWKVKLTATRWLNRSDLNTVDVDNVIWKLRPLRFPKFSRLDLPNLSYDEDTPDMYNMKEYNSEDF